MTATPLRIMKIEIAAAWLQAGNRAVRFSVTDMRLCGNGHENQVRFRYQCQTIDYRSVRPSVAIFRRTAFLDSHTAAMNWFNRPERRFRRRLA